MSIGSRIKEARLRLNMSQEVLAKSIGVTKGAVGNYETDVSRPKEQILIALMQTLKVDANYIYQDYISSLKAPVGQSGENDISEQEKLLIMAYRAKPEMQNAVNTLLGINFTEGASDTIAIYRAAHSTDDHEDEIKLVSRDFIQKLKDAPETDEEL